MYVIQRGSATTVNGVKYIYGFFPQCQPLTIQTKTNTHIQKRKKWMRPHRTTTSLLLRTSDTLPSHPDDVTELYTVDFLVGMGVMVISTRDNRGWTEREEDGKRKDSMPQVSNCTITVTSLPCYHWPLYSQIQNRTKARTSQREKKKETDRRERVTQTETENEGGGRQRARRETDQRTAREKRGFHTNTTPINTTNTTPPVGSLPMAAISTPFRTPQLRLSQALLVRPRILVPHVHRRSDLRLLQVQHVPWQHLGPYVEW